MIAAKCVGSSGIALHSAWVDKRMQGAPKPMLRPAWGFTGRASSVPGQGFRIDTQLNSPQLFCIHLILFIIPGSRKVPVGAARGPRASIFLYDGSGWLNPDVGSCSDTDLHHREPRALPARRMGGSKQTFRVRTKMRPDVLAALRTSHSILSRFWLE